MLAVSHSSLVLLLRAGSGGPTDTRRSVSLAHQPGAEAAGGGFPVGDMPSVADSRFQTAAGQSDTSIAMGMGTLGASPADDEDTNMMAPPSNHDWLLESAWQDLLSDADVRQIHS